MNFSAFVYHHIFLLRNNNPLSDLDIKFNYILDQVATFFKYITNTIT